MEETQFPPGVLEGQSPSILFQREVSFPGLLTQTQRRPGQGPYFFACRRKSATVARLVTCSGFIRISMIAGFFEAEARL